MAGVRIDAAPDRRGRASERLSLRGDPGRDLVCARGAGTGRPLREPRDEQGAVPVHHGRADRGERGERLRQRAGEPAVLNQHRRASCNGSFVIPSSAGYQRFCSNYLATAKERVRSRRSSSRTRRRPTTCSGRRTRGRRPIGDPDEKQTGLVVALDVQTGKHKPIYGMGRHNHENNVAIPGFDDLVVLSGDDTFTSGPLTIRRSPCAGCEPAQSQLYSYIAPDTDALLADEGDLWAFVSDNAGRQRLLRLHPGRRRRHRALREGAEEHRDGLETDGSELKAADVGFPLPPTTGSWQRDNRTTTADRPRRPQWVLEYWSQLEQRLPVRPRRGHRVRQAPGHGERRLPRRLGAGWTAASPERRTSRRTAVSGRWCSTRTTRPR